MNSESRRQTVSVTANPLSGIRAIKDNSPFYNDDSLLLQALVNSSFAYVVLDHAWDVVDISESLCRLIGVSRESAIGSNWVETFIPSEQRDFKRAQLRRIIGSSGASLSEYETHVISRAGKLLTVHWQTARFEDEFGGSSVLVALGTDVTDQHRFTSLQTRNPNPALLLSRNCDIELANDAAQVLIEEIAGEGGACVEAWRAFIRRAASASASFSGEFTLANSSYVFTGEPDQEGIRLYGMNVTDQQALSAQLDELAQNLPGALWEYHLYGDGSESIEYRSPGCEWVWEIDAATLGGNPASLWDMVLPEDLPAMRQSIAESARNLTRWDAEWRIRPKSGRVKWLRATANPSRVADGATRWVAMAFDITETKSARQAAERALQNIIEVLSNAVEARDPYTAGHERRVAVIATQIGEALGLDAHRLMGLELAALVHDVGKIQIPAEILSKPSRLSDEEMALVKMHPVVGANLLEGIHFDWPIRTIIRQHHERFDGSGYPDGLKGEDILLEARIIGVADTLEAMASHRPYRPALGIEPAAREIRDGAGTRYDPEVAAACLRLVELQTLEL